ncbi:MAG: sulfite exporter TauE/SafE family protein [Acutalibacteraceae bacterium]|nr:sulfite exporter TauE/SafE family protein [Acutalibacteraceae bacterium]
MKNKSKIFSYLCGILIGAVNGLFGAGGGIITVPILRKAGLEAKQSHANAVAVILPVSILSGVLYLVNGKVQFSDVSPYILWGLIGSVLGTFVLKKISPLWLKRIFGIFVIYAGVRMILR